MTEWTVVATGSYDVSPFRAMCSLFSCTRAIGHLFVALNFGNRSIEAMRELSTEEINNISGGARRNHGQIGGAGHMALGALGGAAMGASWGLRIGSMVGVIGGPAGMGIGAAFGVGVGALGGAIVYMVR